MLIKQVSVFMENKPGKIGAITKVLNEHKIDIRAFSIADTCEFGILRMIVRDPEHTAETLRAAGFTAQLNEVLVAVIEDHIGAFDTVVRLLSKNDIDIRYMYSFMGEREYKARVVINAADMKKALVVLQKNDVELLDEASI